MRIKFHNTKVLQNLTFIFRRETSNPSLKNPDFAREFEAVVKTAG